MKTWLILIALALLAGLVVLGSGPDEPAVPSAPDRPPGPWFEVRVVKPRAARPFFGLLPDGLFGLPPDELRFDHTSPGAEVVEVGRDRLELRADGWSLVLETDGQGRVAPGTRLVFPLELADRQRTLRCRPADQLSGSFSSTTRDGSDGLDELDGQFLFELPTCEDAATGKALEWPPRPLTVRGSFARLSSGRD